MAQSSQSKSPPEEWPAWQRVSLLILTTFTACTFLLALAEVGVRVRHMVRYGGNFFGIEDTYAVDSASGLRIPIPGGRFGPISINSFGFRSPEIEKAKPPGRLRIAFLGGSTTYCAEVSRNEMTWPYLVWKTLHERWPALDLDYINAGVPGYTTETLLRSLETRVSQFQPDVIVIYEATNDLSSNSYDLAREQGVVHARQEETIGWLGRHSLLAYLVGKNLEVLRQQWRAQGQVGKIKLDVARLDAMFRNDYTKLVEAGMKVAPLVVTVTFSPRIRAGQSAEDRRAAAITSLYYMPYMTIDDLITAFDSYNQVIRDVAKAQGTILIAGEYSIPGDAQHYVDSVHFSDAGSILMAKRVAQALIASPSIQAYIATKAQQVENAK
jgi:lysophospholipase L1-like esterase